MARPPRPPVRASVFYDGECGLCTALVVFARARDWHHRLRFAPLQSAEARARLAAFGWDAAQLNSLVLLEQGRPSLRSTAALRLCRYLAPPWPLLAALLLFPRRWRDGVYDWVARRRRRWRANPRR